MTLKKLLLTLAIFTFLSTILTISIFEKVQAAGEFLTSCQVDYAMTNNGMTQVTNKIELTNLTSKYFSSEYSLSLGDVVITDFSATDASGHLEAEQSYKDQNTTISVKFNDQLVGKDKIRKFSLSYKTSDLTEKLGKIWEVNIPKVGSSAGIGDYKIRILVPIPFGKMLYISPKPQNITENSFENSWIPRNIYSFSKESVIQNGISASFGEAQFLRFDLGFNLKNDDLAPSAKEVAMPSDNAYQKIYISKIEPEPSTVQIDTDGNWVASYKLRSRQNVTVKISGYAQILPMALIPQPKLTDSNKGYYLSEQKFWESQDLQMISESSRLKTPQAIYDFITNRLALDEGSVSEAERKGGKAAYDSSKAVGSQDFTDLFITLCRAGNIPARETEGVIVSTKGNYSHTWAQFWDDNLGWVQVDPSLGKSIGEVDYFSKTDFKHLSLVTRGVSSELPKIPDEVKVEFADNLPANKGKLQISFDLPKYPISIFTTNAKIILENLGNTGLYDKKINVGVQGAQLLSDDSITIEIIPPFSRIEVPVTLKPLNFLLAKNIEIEAKVDNQQFLAQFKTKSGWILLLGVFILSCAFCFSIYQLFLVTRKIRWPKRNG